MKKKEFLKQINSGIERGAKAKLAETLGVSRPSVIEWFNGRSKPSEQNVQKMAGLFSIDEQELWDMFNGKYDEPDTPYQPQPGEFEQTVKAVPLTKSNTIQLPILADDRQATNDGKVSLEAFLARYRTFLKAARSNKTSDAFENALRKLLTFRRIKYLEDITPALLDELAITLKADIKGTAAGLNRSIRALKTAMRQAEFWDLIPPQNWKKVSKFKENKGRVEYHTPSEIKQILNIFNPQWRLVVLLGCRAGLRRGEIANLKWADVDFKKNQLYIAPNKTEKHRFIPIAEDLRNALEKAKQGRKKEIYVINVGENEKRNSKDYLTAYYLKATSGLPFNCTIHKLRHTFASHLVQNGIDLYRVSKLLGHSSIQMTEIYAHLATADLTSAVKKLPKIK